MTHTIIIDYLGRCPECGEMGTTGSGICLKCGVKVIKGKPMKSKIGQAVQQKFKERGRIKP